MSMQPVRRYRRATPRQRGQDRQPTARQQPAAALLALFATHARHAHYVMFEDIQRADASHTLRYAEEREQPAKRRHARRGAMVRRQYIRARRYGALRGYVVVA